VGRSLSLSPYQLFQLDLACNPISEAFGTDPYIVGSTLTDPHPRDIDVRLILPDKKYDRLIRTPEMRTILSFAFTAYLVQATGLPIDFGIQRMTEANEQHKGPRNPLGGRRLSNWVGDAKRSKEQA
jgi:hypothetical protein